MIYTTVLLPPGGYPIAVNKYISYHTNNDRQPVTKNFTPFHYTCRRFTSFHLKLHPTTLHSTSLPSHLA